ncbi:MAG: ribonuclease R [Clostridiales bacterium]|nr:ribonuclease R [Clostridiales bacterium]
MTKKNKRKTLVGTLSKHRKGFGFVSCEETERDIFISSSSMGNAMNGDTVEVDLIPEYLWKGSPEGIITKILERKTAEVTGTFEKNKKYGFVVPEGKRQTEDIFVRKKDFSGAQKGDKVVVKITKYPDKYNSAEGRITEIISRCGQPGGDIMAIARSYGMRDTFPSRVNAQAKAMKNRGVQIEDLKGRKDLTDKIVFTIDGADSKDFDDAVSIERTEKGNFLLGVHIADVTAYVQEDSPLDKEALKRGTSVYLMDQVIPMLPKALSNDICSLNPGKDRLTLSVTMEVTPEGVVVDHGIYESVIRSKERLVYDDVSDLLENDDEAMTGRYAHIKENLKDMDALALALRQRRKERGSLDFDLDEAHICLDEKGVPVSIECTQRRSANKMIEEFMLLANETVAEHFYWLEVPFIYRVHEKPDMEKIGELRLFLSGVGIVLKGISDSVHPKAISAVIEKVQGKPNERVVNYAALRAMQKAYYGTACDGHFGLALKYYCHFTSPIRRYPDLMIHRIIKAILKEGTTGKNIKHFKKRVAAAAEQSSEAERLAINVERDVEKMKKAEYMTYHIGEIFDGIVSGVKDYGIYVQLENTVEGLVRAEHVEDKEGRINYKLGDSVRIMVEHSDPDRREIDFIIAGRG